MKPVIISEKPSQAKSYAAAFKIKNKEKSHIEIEPNDIFKKGAYITWGFGHLVELKKPSEQTEGISEQWSLSSLPYLPKKLDYTVDKSKSQQFNAIKKLCQNTNLIINACDVDREGSNIFYLIVEHAGIKNKTIKRLWINSLEPDEVKKGFQNLRDNDKDYLMYQEAKARMVSDWLIGMNLSPLYTLKFQAAGIVDQTFGIGRVQTPTLYMIYNRHQEIENFKPEAFYEIHGLFSKDQEQYKGKMKIKEKDRAAAQEVLDTMQGTSTGTVTSVNKELKKQQSPKLHSLSTLQTAANKKWKYSPAKTLEIMQNLYERKLVSYPRTDTQFITNQEFNYLKSNINRYLKMFNINQEIAYSEPRKRYVNDSKVQEHYAIILTKSVKQQQTEGLSPEELKIFMEIYHTTISMFLPDYEYEVTELVTTVRDNDFFTKGRIDQSLGWKALFKKENTENDKKEAVLPDVTEGENVNADVSIYEGITEPPKPYTEGQLITVMKTCGKQVEDEEDNEILKEVEGIGTEATRAAVIETLKDRHKYISVNKNKVEITNKGIVLCKAVTNTLLSSAEMTAKWERSLSEISDRNMTYDVFIENVAKYIKHQVNKVDEDLENNNIKDSVDAANEDSHFGSCPSCHQGMISERYYKDKNGKKKKLFPCSNQDCNFVIFGSIAGKSLSVKNVRDLVEKGKTSAKVKGLKSKNGNKFDAFLILNQHNKVKFIFD